MCSIHSSTYQKIEGGVISAVVRTYPWFYAQGSFPVVLEGRLYFYYYFIYYFIGEGIDES